MKIKEDQANLQILSVDNIQTSLFLEGVIRKQNIRKAEIDKIKIE